MAIPLIKPVFDYSEFKNLQKCLESCHVTQGIFTTKFENMFARKHNVPYACAVTSCTTALHLALVALEIKPGDEVILPSFTWISTANAIEYIGAKPIFVDIMENTFTIDPKAIYKAITPNTRAIIPVHLFGLCADIEPIISIAQKHNLYIVEDAACAMGSKYKNDYAGTFGDIGCFSFHPRKVITTGEGGMLTTNNPTIDKLFRVLRNHGAIQQKTTQPWEFAEFHTCGFNYRMSDIQAAVGCAQIEKIDTILHTRSKIARMYIQELKNVPGIAIPYVPKGYKHSWQSFVIRITKGGESRRNHIMQQMKDALIETRPGTMAVHNTDFYKKKYSLKPELCPKAILCETTSLTLPIVHDMNIHDVIRIVNILKHT